MALTAEAPVPTRPHPGEVGQVRGRPLPARGRPRRLRWARVAYWTGTWAAALLAGVGLGVASRLGDDLAGGWSWVANVGGPWLVLAFVVGAAGPSSRQAAARGAATMACAVGAYYAWIALVQHGAGRHDLAAMAALWAVVGVASGAVFGAAGRSWRAGRRLGRLAGAALLSAALVGEAALLLPAGQPAGARAVLLAELVIGGALPWALLRHPRDVAGGAALAASLLPVAVVATSAVLAAAARLTA